MYSTALKMLEQVQSNAAMLLTSAVVAAMVSAIVALVGHAISRKNAQLAAQISSQNAALSAKLEAAKKLADSRQRWIDQMREDMAEFVALAAVRQRNFDNDTLKNNDVFEKLLMVNARINMRMNPKDIDYEKLDQLMGYCIFPENANGSGASSRAFVSLCQIILKREWDVLKSDLRNLDLAGHVE